MNDILKVKALLLVTVILTLSIQKLSATEQFALKTGKNCSFCHVDKNGGALNSVGFAYIKNGYHYPIPQKVLKATSEKLNTGHRIFYIILRYLHIIASVILLGAIFYVHIFIKPVNITGGIPKHERILGLTCLFVTAVTGVFLTLNRINRFGQFFDNTFGFILFIKIGLFLLMLLVALFAVTVIHKKMKDEKKALPAGPAELTRANLPYCDGRSGGPAYIVHENKIFDVSRSPKWKDGVHFKKHRAGSDLTESMKGAPHGPEVLDKVEYLGTMEMEKGAGTTVSPARKIFIVMAYTNLILIFLILLCIALWRTGVQFIPTCFSERGVTNAQSCIKCHNNLHPGIYLDWKRSVHSYVGTDCYKCHQVSAADSKLVNKEHLDNYEKPISVVVSPKVCAGCHPIKYNEYRRSKHANTLE
ncbi:MAG: hypothetical protein JXA18_05480, partial [Chitinispirillaceae bacterium]|nr:hypothetical protein [Chitinispirillaceae bacterium]